MKSSVVPGEKHLTASAFILTQETPKRVLLLHHRKLNTWLQVGGHVENNENPIEAIIREVREETGIAISFLLEQILPIGNDANELPVPRFFLEEKIPAYGDEPEHFHLDLFYVVKVPFQVIARNDTESNDLKWFSREETSRLPMFRNTRELVKKVMR